MRSITKKIYTMPVFMIVLWLFGTLAKLKVSPRFIRWCMNLAGERVGKLWNSGHEVELEKIASGWTEQMPKPHEQFPITSLSDNVAIGEIHVNCSLRRSGNIQACYNLMQFDRAIVERMGGKFIVLESQANSSQKHCKIAICRSEDDFGELKSVWQNHEVKN